MAPSKEKSGKVMAAHLKLSGFTMTTLQLLLSPANVLQTAHDDLLACGGVPFGKEEELNALIRDITKPIIEKAAEKKPSDFYDVNVTIRDPAYQIEGRARAFARGIIITENKKLVSFYKNSPLDEELLGNVVEAIATSIEKLCGEYFSHQFA